MAPFLSRDLVERVCRFVDGPVAVIRVATTCTDWRDAVHSDSLWLLKAQQDSLNDKARIFEVERGHETALTFYARVFLLKVTQERPAAGRARVASSRSHRHPVSAPVLRVPCHTVQGFPMQDDRPVPAYEYYREDANGEYLIIDDLIAHDLPDPQWSQLPAALAAWRDDPTSATEVYGPITEWRYAGIRKAIAAWIADPASARAQYGAISSWNTSAVTDMSRAFDVEYWPLSNSSGEYPCWLLRSIDLSHSGQHPQRHRWVSFNEDISHWDVSNVRDMTGMFCGLRLFNGDLSCWDVGQVKSMAFMFDGAHSFTGDISRWNVSNVENMMAMFSGASEFDGVLSRWDVSNVENMSDMFFLATSFSGRGGLSDWEVEDVDHATDMFYGAASFTHTLRGQWSYICVDIQELMFDNRCPGSIAARPIRVRKRKRRTADGDGS